MKLVGFIPTNSIPTIEELVSYCHHQRLETSVASNNITVSYLESSSIGNRDVEILVTKDGVRYESKFPELTSYLFIALIILFLLLLVLPRKIWLLFLLVIPFILISIKISFDKRLSKLVRAIIPSSRMVVPEMAKEEHVAWINNPNVCPACGTQKNKYSKTCLSCGLVIGQNKEMKTTQNITHNIPIKYYYKKDL